MDLASPDRADLVDLGRVRLRVWEWGDPAAPAVVCVHGAYDHGRMWDGLAPEVAAMGFRVVAPDVRGHGDSSRLSTGHIFASSALDLALLARHVGPPVGLIGHSFGGGQVLHVAGVWPELVRWVVNLDGLGPPAEVFEDGDLAEAAGAGLAAAARVRSTPPRVYATREEMTERRRRVNTRLPAAWLDHLVEHGSVAVEGGFTWKADPMFSVGLPGPFSVEHLEAEHAAVRAPTLVLTGGEDDTWSDLSPAEVEGRVASIPAARHVVVPGAGHYVHLERPDVVLAELRSFLDEIGS